MVETRGVARVVLLWCRVIVISWCRVFSTQEKQQQKQQQQQQQQLSTQQQLVIKQLVATDALIKKETRF
jgi:hypothetical protein